ncbi:MAG TPA: LAGLIDADG family homing endonuclease [Bacteroidales bacterium]|mgnify:CR=1 FL=1|nr:LAGLIDADG family homing endonuclease [Bacteroidales bacterium]
MSKIVSLSRSQFAESFLWLNGRKLSLDYYPHMRQIYDSEARESVLMFSRQCVLNSQRIDLSDGSSKLAEDLQPGDAIIGFDVDTYKNVVDVVENVWDNGVAPIYHIITRTGREVFVTDNHPFRKVDSWCEAKNLQEGDLIAVSRDNSCSLQTEQTVENWKYIVAAYLLAEGAISNNSLGFTSGNKILVSELETALKQLDDRLVVKALPEKYKYQYRLNGIGVGKPNPLKTWLIKEKMFGKTSAYKEHPSFIWKLTGEQIKDYLRIWWDTDGYWSLHKNGTNYIGIGLISFPLVKGIQTLLLKLGIHSVIRSKYQPKIYNGTDKKVYVLTIEGQDSIRCFYDNILTYKRPETLVLRKETHNRLVIDKFFVDNLLSSLKNKKNPILYRSSSSKSYAFEKIKRIYNERNIPELKKIIDSDIYFDKVMSVEYIGDLPSTGIEIKNTHTFQIDHLISKNTSKSTSIANIMITNSAMIPGYKSLYVSPTVDQTKIFSHDRVTPVIESSPFIKNYFINSSLVQNVFMKQFLNGSSLYLRYALLTADRLRGMSTDHNLFDEVQDMRLDLIPIIQESMSRSMYKRTLYSGTPKRTQGTLASLWKRSNKGEYVIKCVSCNFWNILGESNIGPIGPICTKCGRHLDIKIGQWVSTYSLSQEPDLQGYRVCLLHFSGAPWVDWKRDVLEKQKHFSRAYFANEVLALEHDEGASPVTMDDIRACCDPNLVMTEEPSALDRSYTNVMGIDYGPVNSENSYTVLVCLQLRGDVVHVVYAKRFMGKEADFSFIHKEVPRLMDKWNCSQLAADYGMGEASNSEIRSKIGFQKVIAFQHLHAQKEKVKWNPKMPAYTLNRNQILGEFFTRVKKKKILFPRFEDFETFGVDMMNVQMKFDEERNSMSYINIGADDFVHATTYALTALELFHGIGGI